MNSMEPVCEICGRDHPEGEEHIWERLPDYEILDGRGAIRKQTKKWKEKYIKEPESLDEIDGAEIRRRAGLAAAEKRKKWREKAMEEYNQMYGENKSEEEPEE